MLYAALKLRVIFGKNRRAAVKYSAICGDILPNTAYTLSLDSSGAYALNISKTHSSISVFAAEYITDSSVNALPEGSMNSAVTPRCENSGVMMNTASSSGIQQPIKRSVFANLPSIAAKISVKVSANSSKIGFCVNMTRQSPAAK